MSIFFICALIIVIFFSQFEEQADRDDLMGIEDNAKRDILFQMNM